MSQVKEKPYSSFSARINDEIVKEPATTTTNFDLFKTSAVNKQRVDDIIQKTQLSSQASTHNRLQFSDKITVFQVTDKFVTKATPDTQADDPQPSKVNLSALTMARKKIKKALLAARSAKDTKKSAKVSDIRKQIRTARDIEFKPLIGMSKELNFLAKELETAQYQSQSYNTSHRASLINDTLFHNYRGAISTERNHHHPLNQSKSLSEIIEQKNKRLNVQQMQTTLSRKLKIISKFERSEANHSRIMKDKRSKYRQQVEEESQKIKVAKARMKNSMEEYRRVHEEREKKQREIMVQKQDFKETIIKSRSEYLKKKNELAMNLAKERYEINNMLENELKKSKNLASQKSMKARQLHEEHIQEVKKKAEQKNKEIQQKQVLFTQKRESETEEHILRLQEERSYKEQKKKEGIKQSLQKDPSLYLWMQKGASGNRLKQSIGGELQEDLEQLQKKSIIREQLQKDFGQESMKRSESQSLKITIRDEGQGDNDNQQLRIATIFHAKSQSQPHSQQRKASKKVRIKEPRQEVGGGGTTTGADSTNRANTSPNRQDIKRLERIVDTDKYDYTNMGYQWDIINGYMGGEKINKKISYERALAMTQDSRTLPFEIRKKERLFSIGQCFKLEKDLSDKDLENAIKFLQLRSENIDKEKSLQLARKVSCRFNDMLNANFSRKNGMSQLLQSQLKENEADIELRTNNIQMELMKDLVNYYAAKEVMVKADEGSQQVAATTESQQKSPSKKAEKKSKSENKPVKNVPGKSPTKEESPLKRIGQFQIEKTKREELEARQREQMKNVVRVLARRSQNRAYRNYYEQLEQEENGIKSYRSSINSLEGAELDIGKPIGDKSGQQAKRVKSPQILSLTLVNSQNQSLNFQAMRKNLYSSGSFQYQLKPINEELQQPLMQQDHQTARLDPNPSLQQIPEKLSALQRLKLNKTDQNFNKKKVMIINDKGNSNNRNYQSLSKRASTHNASPESSTRVHTRHTTALHSSQVHFRHTKNASSFVPSGMIAQASSSLLQSQLVPQTAPPHQQSALIPVLRLKKGSFTEHQLQNLEKMKLKQQQSEQMREMFLDQKRKKAQDTSVQKFEYIQRQMEKKSLQKIEEQECRKRAMDDHLSQIRNMKRESQQARILEKEERRRKNYDMMIKQTLESTEVKQERLNRKLKKIQDLEVNKEQTQSIQQRLIQQYAFGRNQSMKMLNEGKKLDQERALGQHLLSDEDEVASNYQLSD